MLLQSSSQQFAGLNEAIVLDGARAVVVLIKTKLCVTCQPATINYALMCRHTVRLRQGHITFICLLPDRYKMVLVLNFEAMPFFFHTKISVNLADRA